MYYYEKNVVTAFKDIISYRTNILVDQISVDKIFGTSSKFGNVFRREEFLWVLYIGGQYFRRAKF